jgi:hypothetical protein
MLVTLLTDLAGPSIAPTCPLSRDLSLSTKSPWWCQAYLWSRPVVFSKSCLRTCVVFFLFPLLLLTQSQVIRNSVTYIEHAVTALDIVCALKHSSCTLYSFGAWACCTSPSSYFYLPVYTCKLISLLALSYTGRGMVWLVVRLRLGPGCAGAQDRV